jgi:DNA-binding NtrC family response regulator
MPIKVLLIEDEELTRNLLKRVIEKEGYNIIVADDGERGLELFNLEKPDIVVTDIKMPGLDGKEVLYRIKRLDPATEVILITGHGDIDTVIHALREGALDYIKKPINVDQLLLSLGRAQEKIIGNKKINPKTSLLILEDDRSTREKLAQILNKEGYNVLTGSNGEEGIDLFMQNKVDILLVDINMPKKMDSKYCMKFGNIPMIVK